MRQIRAKSGRRRFRGRVVLERLHRNSEETHREQCKLVCSALVRNAQRVGLSSVECRPVVYYMYCNVHFEFLHVRLPPSVPQVGILR